MPEPIATASQTPVPVSSSLAGWRPTTGASAPERTDRLMARGAMMTIAGHVTSLARPIAIAWFTRLHGSRALAGFVVLWTCIELGSRLATWGLDRGLQRWADDRRSPAAVAGVLIAGTSALAVAVALSALLPRFGLFEDGAMFSARAALLLALPITAMTNVALRATRGETQIAIYVLARGVTEPLLLLVTGLVLSSWYDGSVALPATLVVSVAGGGAVAATALVGSFGARTLLRTLVEVRAWPVRELVRASYPLGLADVVSSAQSKLDLVAVAIVTFSAQQITAYAIAAELAAVFVAIRIGFDQIVAPFAAEARGDRERLIRIVTTATRWSLYLGVPIAFAMLVAPGRLLDLLGGDGTAAPLLAILMVGRAIEMLLGPSASMLAVIGRPQLSLLNAAAGVSLAVLLDLAAGALGLGPVAVAVASTTSVIASSSLALFGLAKLEGIAPRWSAFRAHRGHVTLRLLPAIRQG